MDALAAAQRRRRSSKLLAPDIRSRNQAFNSTNEIEIIDDPMMDFLASTSVRPLPRSHRNGKQMASTSKEVLQSQDLVSAAGTES